MVAAAVMTLIEAALALGAFCTMDRTEQSERLSNEEPVDDTMSC